MEAVLTPEEARVLGCLLEKAATTPETYPLTLNALRLACNQSSSREPVVDYDDAVVHEAMAGLRDKQMARVVLSPSNRAAKYRHVMDERFGLDAQEKALMGLLLLRGPQTVAELRTRSERLADFDGVGEIEAALRRLEEREGGLVELQERLAGQKEARYRQLLSDPPPAPAGWTGSGGAPGGGTGRARGGEVALLAERLEAVVAELAELRAAVEQIQADLGYAAE